MNQEQIKGLIADVVAAGVEVLVDRLAHSVPAGPVRMVRISELVVNPRKYQFRLSTINAAGTDDRLRDCSAFRRELAGVVLVWPEPSGQLALLDGHHRLQLARRSGVEELAALVVDAPDARTARVMGALANVAAGHASTADVARLMRDEGLSANQMEAHGVSRRSRLVIDAAALLPLDEGLFGRVCTGELEVELAIALAGAGDHAHQRALAHEAQRRRWSADQVAEAAAMAAVARVNTTTPDGCLPGLEGLLLEANSDLGEVLAVRAAIRRALSQELKALSTVARQRAARSLEDHGVAVIDVEAAVDARDTSKAAARLFDLMAGHRGPLMNCIRELAGKVKGRRSAGEVVANHLAEVRAAIEAELNA